MPLFDSVNQTAEMLAMIYCGIVIGIIYDLIGIFRRLFARHKIAIRFLRFYLLYDRRKAENSFIYRNFNRNLVAIFRH